MIYSRITQNSRGVTLIELVMAIVIIGIAFVGLMTAYVSVISRSADPWVTQQALSLANSLMEEISAKPFVDTPGANACPKTAAATRADFVKICDYDGYTIDPDSTAWTDINNNDLQIARFTLSVSVANATPSTYGSVDAADAVIITVTVTSKALNNPVRLSAYRTREPT